MTDNCAQRNDPHRWSVGHPVMIRLRKRLIPIALKRMFICFPPRKKGEELCKKPIKTGVLQSSEQEAFNGSLLDKLVATFLQKKVDEYGGPEEVGETLWLCIESLIILYKQIRWSQDWNQFSLAVIQFVHAVTGKPIVKGLTVMLERVKYIVESLGDGGLQSSESYTNPFSLIRYYIGKYEETHNHPVMVKIKKMFYYIMSFSLLDKFGITFETFWYEKAEAEYIKTQHSNQVNFLASILDGASFILERVYDCIMTQSWSPIIHSGHNYGKWVEEVYFLKETSQKLHNPEAQGISLHEYLNRLDACIEKGEAITKFATEIDPSSKSLIRRLLSDMRLQRADEYTRAAARADRDMPYGLLLFGPSSVAKSTLMKMIEAVFAQVRSLPQGDEYRYVRTFADPYYSGFRTSMWSLILDDIAAARPDTVSEDISMKEILQILNYVAVCPPQAELADKGKTPLRPKLVQCSTNTKNLSAHVWYNNPLAILRRLPIVITLLVKEEYCVLSDDGTVPDLYNRQLDTSRCPELPDGELPDYWIFRVEKVVSHSTGEGENLRQYAKYAPFWKDKLDFNDVYELLARLAQDFIRFRDKQERIKRDNKKFDDIRVCDKCYYVTTKCKCIVIHPDTVGVMQSTDIVEYPVFSLSIIFLVGCFLAGMVRAFIAYAFIRVTNGIKLLKKNLKEEIITCGQDVAVNAVNAVLESSRVQYGVLDRGGEMATHISRTAVNVVKTEAKRIASDTLDAAVKPVTDVWAEISSKVNHSMLSASEKLKFELNLVKKHMVELGQKARSARIPNKVVLTVITVVPLLAGAAYIWKHLTAFQLQGSRDIGERPKANDEKENPWYRDDYEPSTFDVGVLSASWKNRPIDLVAEKIYRNIFFATARFERDGVKKKREMRILCVGGNLCVTNNHNIPEVEVNLTVVLSKQTPGVGNNFEFKLGKEDTFRLPESDLVFFRIGCMPPKANLVDIFPSENFRTVCNGALLGRNAEGSDETRALRGIKFDPEFYTHQLDRKFKSWVYSAAEATVNGDCGSVVLGFAPTGPTILGLHQTGGRYCKMTAVQITREHISMAKDFFQISMIQCGSPDLTDKNGKAIVVQPLHHKSVFRYLESGTANVYGSLPGFRATGKSRVTRTHVHKAMVEDGYAVKTGPPVMRGWAPWRHAATDVIQQVFQLKQNVVDKCADAFAEDIISRLPQDQFDEMIILDNDTTLNGYPGTKFIDKMNRRTSMGFPYREKKIFYLTYKGKVDVWQDYVIFHDKFYDRVDGIIELYEKGVRYMPIFISHLKDEPIKISKIVDKKTRVFSSGPAEWCFVVRKYLLSFVRVVQNNKYIFESAPGTNAASAEWDKIYHYLTAFGTQRVVAGDYSKFDKRMSAQWIIAAFRVIDRILVRAKWSETNRRIVQCIGYDIAFPLTDFNGDLVEFWGSNPSGHPLTVIVNGLVNALLIRYSWHEVGNPLSAFKTSVNLMTYGDDNIMGIKESVTNFDHTVLVRELDKIGVIYTMADKEALSVPFVDIKDVSFLKRKWVFSPELKQFVCMLEHDSIAKMLTMHIPSKVVCVEQHSVDVMYTALCEYFYYGRERFNERREFFLKVIDQYDLHPYFEEFPVFDDLIAGYIENSKGVYPGDVCKICSQ